MSTTEHNINPQDAPTGAYVGLRMSDDLLQALKERAADEDRSLSSLLRIAARAYLADAA